MKSHFLVTALCASSIAVACPAHAAGKALGDPVAVGAGLTIDPIVEARVRYETVDQPTVDADALTARLRLGYEIKHAPSHLSFLIEGEGLLALDDSYNAFPYPFPGSSQRRPGFATVADPEGVDLNRLQIQYKSKALTVTVGRQRINLDDQRFVGSVGWRQNEQTFDAVRAEATVGPVSLDGTYSFRQATIFGSEAGVRRLLDGEFVFLGAGAKLGPVTAKAFTYLIDYDEAFAFANSSATYGLRAAGAVPLSKAVKLNVAASYARQNELGSNPVSYQADYLLGEAGIAVAGFGLTGGYEKLGADAGAVRSFQTPLATLHKFNGWADLFLTTPAGGLEDKYVTLTKAFPKVKALPGLSATVAYHDFSSDIGNVRYGTEWDASIGLKTGKVAWLGKFADYQAQGFGVDRRIVWLQAELAF